MNTSRLMIAFAVLAAITVAIATTSFSAPPKAANPYEDFALRHPYDLSGIPAESAAYYRGSDYAQRHSENAIDVSDYALRHPELQVADNADFFLRHSAWSSLSPVLDTSDYFLRHPEFRIP